jgi:hypothetical protein
MSPKSTRPAKHAVSANATLPADIELTPERCEYMAADKVRVTLKTDAGDPVTYTLTPKMLVKSINLSVALINNYATKIDIEF